MGSLAPPITDAVEVRDGQRMFFGEWPGDGPTLVCCHGLTSTHRNFAALARELEGSVHIVAMDLLGRGLSDRPPAGSYGMDRHGADVVELMRALGIERAILAGHSMGAYVATAALDLAPDRGLGLVLLDGGVFMDPPGIEIDPDETAKKVLGPVMDRLRRTFSSVDEYYGFFKLTPYWEGHWGEIVEDYLAYDLGRFGHAYRSKCDATAAMEDWRDLLTNPENGARLGRVERPVLAIGAEVGMDPSQPQVLTEAHVERLRQLVVDADFVRIPDTTHHTVTLSEHGARATAEAIAKFVEVS